MNTVLRIYIFGIIDSSSSTQNITVFAEYKNLRGVAKIMVGADTLNALRSDVEGLRSFAESRYPSLTQEGLRKFGTKLFNFVMTDRVADVLSQASGDAVGKDGHLPIEIVAEDFEIAAWPWEYMYHPINKVFISDETHPISRNIFSIQTSKELSIKPGPIRILVILGVSPDDKYTKPDEEIRVIEEVFSANLGEARYSLKVLPATDYRRLQAVVQDTRYDIVHYFGHAGFDFEEQAGYLAIERRGAKSFRIYSRIFAQLLASSDVRLVFLNACKTAQSSNGESAGRSSVAARLLDGGIPAVVGMQFSMPDMSAHSLAAGVYRALLNSKSVGAAIRAGRTSMHLTENAEFFEWGIPVLYTTDPSHVIFPGMDTMSATQLLIPEKGGRSQMTLDNFEEAAPLLGTKDVYDGSTLRVGLLDIDAKVGFLKDIVLVANAAQDYCKFEVIYQAVPSGYIRSDFDKHRETQTFVPRLAPLLKSLEKTLKLNFVCGLTQHPIANETGKHWIWNEFAGAVKDARNLFVVSTCDLRRYALEAKVPFSKAVLYVCLRQLVALASDDLRFHKKTVGCLFDDCVDRDDLVEGLRRMKFDHKRCRALVQDERQLAAIDSLLEINFVDEIKAQRRSAVKRGPRKK